MLFNRDEIFLVKYYLESIKWNHFFQRVENYENIWRRFKVLIKFWFSLNLNTLLIFLLFKSFEELEYFSDIFSEDISLIFVLKHFKLYSFFIFLHIRVSIFFSQLLLLIFWSFLFLKKFRYSLSGDRFLTSLNFYFNRLIFCLAIIIGMFSLFLKYTLLFLLVVTKKRL